MHNELSNLVSRLSRKRNLVRHLERHSRESQGYLITEIDYTLALRSKFKSSHTLKTTKV